MFNRVKRAIWNGAQKSVVAVVMGGVVYVSQYLPGVSELITEEGVTKMVGLVLETVVAMVVPGAAVWLIPNKKD